MILVQSVSKVYRLYSRPSDRIRETFPIIGGKRHEEFRALDDVSLTVEPGETLGVVGPNGSGKSTLLQVVCGIVQPTRGRVSTEGRIAALLELGAGFNPEFTGRENVFLNGEIMGLSRSEVEAVFADIEAFADIGEFIDRPVKEYSSGMYVRLAFSTAIHVDPDILIVDEALAVGDAVFSNRCIKKFEELKARGVTILFVSHDLGLVKQLADRAILMVDGAIRVEGKPSDVVNRYVGLVLARDEEGSSRDSSKGRSGTFRHGDGSSRIKEVSLRNESGAEAGTFTAGDGAHVEVRVEANRTVEEVVVGILVRNRLGIDVYGTNSRIEGVPIGPLNAGEEAVVEFAFDCHFTRQDYTLTVATQNWDGTSQDWLDDVLSFTVVDSKDTAGVVSLGTKIQWRKP